MAKNKHGVIFKKVVEWLAFDTTPKAAWLQKDEDGEFWLDMDVTVRSKMEKLIKGVTQEQLEDQDIVDELWRKARHNARYDYKYNGNLTHYAVVCDYPDWELLGFLNECAKQPYKTTVIITSLNFKRTFQGNSKTPYAETAVIYDMLKEEQNENNKADRLDDKSKKLEQERKKDYAMTRDLLKCTKGLDETEELVLRTKNGRRATAKDIQRLGDKLKKLDYDAYRLVTLNTWDEKLCKSVPLPHKDVLEPNEFVYKLIAFVRTYGPALGINLKLDTELDSATSTFQLRDWVDAQPSIQRRDWYEHMRSSECDVSTTIWDYPERVESAEISQSNSSIRRRQGCSMYDLINAVLQIKWYVFSQDITDWVDPDYQVHGESEIVPQPVEYTGTWYQDINGDLHEIDAEEEVEVTEEMIVETFKEIQQRRRNKSNIKVTQWRNTTI